MVDIAQKSDIERLYDSIEKVANGMVDFKINQVKTDDAIRDLRSEVKDLKNHVIGKEKWRNRIQWGLIIAVAGGLAASCLSFLH